MLRQLRLRKSASPKSGHLAVTEWRRQARTATAWVAMGLAAFHGFLTLNSQPYTGILGAIDPEKIRQIIIILYHFCWVWGLDHDADSQELVDATAPAIDRVGRQTTMVKSTIDFHSSPPPLRKLRQTPPLPKLSHEFLRFGSSGFLAAFL
jgi:hypothetical protein